ncbi:nucleoside deaminase [Pontibaca salina]|uniref:Nucleoside deaminase n=1 Tax=Pontibaca salina TaxID=2795731 RepID=A0A934M138_9RHOB|nr:nucleoside deaminase [Pontibaca salina]MBI6630640.1 nucleoside deaminase [Pontibaca salina]
MAQDQDHMAAAIALAERNVAEGGSPFGAVLVQGGQVLERAVNEAHLSGDPTAHAELVAIQRACRSHGAAAVRGATIYASGQPCPMCLSACYAAGLGRVVFAGSNAEAAPFELSSQRIYDEFSRPLAQQSLAIEQQANGARIAALYRDWRARQDAK